MAISFGKGGVGGKEGGDNGGFAASHVFNIHFEVWHVSVRDAGSRKKVWQRSVTDDKAEYGGDRGERCNHFILLSFILGKLFGDV